MGHTLMADNGKAELANRHKPATASSAGRPGTWLLVVAGIAVIVMGYGNFRGAVTPAEVAAEAFDTAGLETIHVTNRSSSIVFGQADVSEVQVSLSGNVNSDQLQVERDGSNLNINVRRQWWTLPFLNFRGHELTVLLPRNFEPVVEITSSSGRVLLEEASLAGVMVRSSSGRVCLDDATVEGDVTISTSSGAVCVQDVDIAGRLAVTVSSGSADLVDALADSYDFISSSGRFSAEGLAGTTLNARVSSGRLTLEAETLLEDWNVQSSSGGVTVSFGKPPADFTLDHEASSGGLRVSDRYGLELPNGRRNQVTASFGNGGPRLSVRTSSGRFTLD